MKKFLFAMLFLLLVGCNNTSSTIIQDTATEPSHELSTSTGSIVELSEPIGIEYPVPTSLPDINSISLLVDAPSTYSKKDLEACVNFIISQTIPDSGMTYQALTDSFCKENLGFDTREGFLNDVEGRIDEALFVYQNAESINQLINYIFTNTDISLPADYIDSRVEEYFSILSNELAFDGTDMDKYLSENNLSSVEELKNSLKEKQLLSFTKEAIFLHIASVNNITINEDEFEDYLSNMAAVYGYDIEEFIEIFSTDYRNAKDYWKAFYLTGKVEEHLLSKAKIEITKNPTVSVGEIVGFKSAE